MITKYTGSITEFIDCEVIEFIMIDEGNVLSISEIKSYTLDNPIIKYHRAAIKTGDGNWVATFTDKDGGFIVNNLIVYDRLGNPVGFVDLTQNIDVTRYGIRSIEVKLDYSTVTKSVNFDLKLNYRSHLAMTSAKLAHANLFDTKFGENRAATLTEIKSSHSTRQVYTRNLIASRRNDKLLYRYSGNLMRGNHKLTLKNTVVDKSLIDDYGIHEIITIDGTHYLLSYSMRYLKLTITNLTTNEQVTFDDFGYIKNRLSIGSNYIIVETNEGRRLIDTVELVSNHLTRYVNRSNLDITTEFNSIKVKLDLPVVNDNIIFAKDPIDKTLLPYYLDSNDNVVPLCRYLKDIIDELELSDINLPIIYASKGLLLLGHVDQLGNITTVKINDIETDYPEYYSYKLPGTGSKVRYSNNADRHLELVKKFNNTLIGCNVDDITFLTPELIFVNKALNSFTEYRNQQKSKYQEDLMTIANDPYDVYIYYISYEDYKREIGSNKYLISVDSNFNYDDKVYDFAYELKIYDMQGKSGLKNYDKIVKSSNHSLKDINLMSLSLEGCLYGYMEYTSNNYILVKL